MTLQHYPLFDLKLNRTFQPCLFLVALTFFLLTDEIEIFLAY